MDVLQIHGPEQAPLDPTLPDGGLPPVVGVHSFQVFRASADVPALTDQLGWTYHHHVDMACWKGRLYVGWNSCQRDEDVWPSRELFSTSLNGSAWTEPAELFPQGVSTCLRMYFFHASNGRMLAIAGLRTDRDDTSEDRKNALVVREILADHTLGEVFTLQASESIKHPAPRYGTSPDDGFKRSCEELLANRMYLEQQDRGRLLGSRRMKWHDPAAWPGGVVPGDNEKWVCGKAFSFYQCPDNVWIGVSKMGWVTSSADNGNTWSQPYVPASLVTGKAKVWSQRTADGRFALVYNPSKSNRFPLVAVAGEDGVNFSDMRIIQGELPVQRYAGLHRSIGPQYVRGISHWANDGSCSENVMWLVYSMNKEDIWVSRVPLPIKVDETQDIADDFAMFQSGPFIPGWNIYRPKWSSIEITRGALQLQNRDPYDYAQATRIFPESTRITATFDLDIGNFQDADFEINLLSKFGSHRLVQIRIGDADCISALVRQQWTQIGSTSANKPTRFQIDADTVRGLFSISLNGIRVVAESPVAASGGPLHRISFRTGPYRGIGGAIHVKKGTDHPVAEKSYRILNLRIDRAAHS
jgi:hypothetical protein